MREIKALDESIKDLIADAFEREHELKHKEAIEAYKELVRWTPTRSCLRDVLLCSEEYACELWGHEKAKEFIRLVQRLGNALGLESPLCREPNKQP